MTPPQLDGAYVDTTALIPIANQEQPVVGAIRRQLEGFQVLLSANLLEAELRDVFERERQPFDSNVLSDIRWIMPNRPLAGEMASIVGVANLPAARLWHLAVALFFDEVLPGLAFITLDEQQETAARELGLWIP